VHGCLATLGLEIGLHINIKYPAYGVICPRPKPTVYFGQCIMYTEVSPVS